MTFPVTLHLGSSSITLHAVLEMLGFFTGFRYFLFLRRRQGDGIVSTNRTWILIGATLGALIGSRLVGALEQPQELLATAHPWQYIYQNKTVLGGFLGGLFGVEATKKAIGERQASGDLFTFPILLGLIIGRIGCFSMGVAEQTYGIATSGPFGMDLGDGIPRHPVALYEILFLGLLWLLLARIHRRLELAPGAIFKGFLFAYCAFRFLLDFIKPSVPVLAGLSTIQLTALGGIIYYLPYLLHPKKLIAAHA